MSVFLSPQVKKFFDSDDSVSAISVCLLVVDPSINTPNEANKEIGEENLLKIEQELKKLKVPYSKVSRAGMIFADLKLDDLRRVQKMKEVYSIESSKKDFKNKP